MWKSERHRGAPFRCYLVAGATDANEATFAGCRALLRTGQPIALFPEGTTHSNTTMLPLRTGAARIALSAESESG